MAADYKLPAMLMLDFVVMCNYSMPLPFFPGVATTHYHLTKTEIGMVFGAFAIGSFLASVTFGKAMGSVKKKTLLKMCLILAILSTAGFGTIIHFQDKTVFLVLAMVLRFVAGCAAGGVCTLICSLLPVFYPDTVIEKFAYLEITFSFSSIGGTCMGALLFQYVGYQWPFYILALLCLIVG